MNYNVPDWPKKVDKFPRTLDRFRGTSVFFDIKYPPYLIGSIEARKWLSWGALSALISIPEIIEYDMEVLGRLDDWRSSESEKMITQHVNFRILKEMRNYEMHVDYNDRIPHHQADTRLLKESIDHDDIFFCDLDWSRLQRLRNVSRRNPTITENEIDLFNIYTSQYSARTIIENELERIGDIIAQFAEST